MSQYEYEDDGEELDEHDRRELTAAFSESFDVALALLNVVRLAREVSQYREDVRSWLHAVDALADEYPARRIVQVIALSLFELPDAEVVQLLHVEESLVGLAERVLSDAAAE